MQLTLQHGLLSLFIAVSVGSCGDDLVKAEGEPIEINEQLLGVFSTPTSSTSDTNNVSHLLIRPNGTVRWTDFSGCREGDTHRWDHEYAWRAEGFDKIIITNPSGGNVNGPGVEVHVTPGRRCDEIRVSRIREDGTEFSHHWRTRGERCLVPTTCEAHGCSGCKIAWCDPDERPVPCE
jgi:hypothetical protein